MTEKRIRLRNMGDVGFADPRDARGLEPMRKTPALVPGLAQDRLAASSRRILLSGGLRGGDSWLTSSEADPSSLVAPDSETKISVAGPMEFTLNAGCVLVLRALYLPAGYTMQGLEDGYVLNGKRGAITADITWTSGISGTDTTEHIIEMEVSQDEWGAPPSGSGAWSGIRERWIVMSPTGWGTDAAQTRLYGAPGTTAEIEVSYIGGARVVYWCVYELPYEIVASLSDGQGAWGGMTTGAGMPLETFPHEYPVTRASESGNPYEGSLALLEGVAQNYAAAQGGGIHWRAGGEHVDAITDVLSLGASGTGNDEYPPLEITSTTPVNILNSNFTQWDANGPGFSASQLGYCAGYDASQTSGTRSVMCKVTVRWKTSANTGMLRVQTAPHSFVELETTSTSVETSEVVYRFDVSLSPWDAVTFQVLANQETSGTLSLYEVAVVPLPAS